MGASEIGSGRSDERPPGRTRSGGGENSEGGSEDEVRSEPRATVEGEIVEAGRGAARVALYHASHRDRRVVDGNPDQRSRSAIPSIPSGGAVAARGVTYPVCGFRGLAERMAARRRAGAETRVLAKAVGGSGSPGTADGLSTTVGADVSRSGSAFCGGK